MTRVEKRQKRHSRVRRRVRGTQDKPRLSVMLSNRNIYVQFIDDDRGVTLASASSTAVGEGGNNVAIARKVGAAAAEAARSRGIERVVVDRGGFKFHTRLAAMVDALVRGGVKISDRPDAGLVVEAPAVKEKSEAPPAEAKKAGRKKEKS